MACGPGGVMRRSSMSAKAAPALSAGAASQQSGAVLAGLVPSKTTAHCALNLKVISFSEEAKADRRVNRLKKSVWASGHLHGLAEHGFRPSVPWFVTLTYVGENDWRAEHMSQAIKTFRDWCRQVNVPCRYTWVAELQSRGAVHYHLLCWLPINIRMPHWDRSTKTRRGTVRDAAWPHGMTNTEIARSGVGYLMKYLSKLGCMTKFPRGLRLYGIGGLNADGRNTRAWLNLPEWTKRSFGVGELVRRAGGLVVRATGEILESAFKVSIMPFGLVVHPIRPIPDRWHDGAYSTFPRLTT